jgi:hypothetical protein
MKASVMRCGSEEPRRPGIHPQPFLTLFAGGSASALGSREQRRAACASVFEQ